MTRKIHYIISLACLLIIGFSSAAQKARILEFSQDNLPAEMKEYLDQATSDKDKQKANAQLMQQFAPIYGAMSQQEKTQMVSICNVVLKLKVRQLPDVYNFIGVVDLFWNSSPNKDNFDQWLNCIQFIQGRNKKIKDFTDFIEFTSGFLKDRTLTGSRAAQWQAQSGSPYTLKLVGEDIVITFDKVMELYYASDKDNGTIYGTTGKFYYFDSKWKGHGGRLNWDRTGIAPTTCWAVLNNYEAITKFPKFTADSVMFTNNDYFSDPIMGSVEEALSAKLEPEKYTFPKFRSYQKDFRLKDILPGVDYSGSFMMNGSKFITSDTKNPASIIFYREGKPFITVKSTKFTITHDRLVSELASVKIYVGEDSIYNNGILVRYLTSNHQVTMVNDSKRNYYSPYTNTYHNLDMYCEQIVWKMKEDILDMSMLGQAGDQTFSTFESSNYYSEIKFRQLQGIEEINPVVKVYRYMQTQGMAYEFHIEDFARAIHMDIIQAKSMIHLLAKSGLVTYDEALSRVYVKDKLVDYNKAYTKTKGNDYDAINLESSTKNNNAILDLTSNDLKMAGVQKFVVSDSQQVVIYPKNGDLVVHKNRDMSFSGRINAGRFVAFVTDAKFLYDDFKIDLPMVDSMIFYVTQFNNPQEEHIVYTPLYKLVGNIQIDEPDNHCGLKKTKDYPIFTSLENSYVYYDRKDIHNGAYVRDKFYYTLFPFVIKDMVDFKTDSLKFGGVLTSAGIFPDIKEPLRVQRDYSLGFTVTTPKTGFSAYGGKGKFTNVVDLSYEGLRGAGKLEYLTSTSASAKFFFMPDSTVGVTDTFLVKEQGGFPDVRNGKTQLRWFPYADSMRVQQLPGGRQFQMYRGDATLAGVVVLQPAGATASGAVTIGEGTVTSDLFRLGSREMDADVSTFVLRSDVYKNIAFQAQNMKSHVDFDKRRADFTSNTEIGRTELPLLSYAAYVDKFSWQIDKKQLDLINSKSESTMGLEGLSIRERFAHPDQPGAYFVSTDPRRDSLHFNAVRSTYLYNAGQLSCKNVFLLNIGDAVCAPGGDSLHIRAGGDIDLLKKSHILASRGNRFHDFYDCDIIVRGAKSFSGKGNIDYVDAVEKRQKIYMDSIVPDSKGRTIGFGFIPEDKEFTLNDAFGFAGNVRVESDNKNFFFNGGVRLLHKCGDSEKRGLLAYSNYVDPAQIFVSVPEIPTDWKGNRITASILYDKLTLRPYPAFLTNDRAADNELMTAFGSLTYDNEKGEYMIASERKLADTANVVDRYLTLDKQTCTVSGEGPVDWNVKQNFVKIFTYGTASIDYKNSESFNLNSVFGFTFPIDDNVLTAMMQLIVDDLRLAPSNPDNDALRRAMIFYQGEDNGAANYSTYVSTGFYDKIPKEFESTILLEGINWQYSPALGYYYNGVAGLAAIGKKQVHLATRVKAQINKRGNGVYLTLYIQVAGDHWYYFNYEFNSQVMTIQSSVGEWVDMIRAIPADKRRVAGKSDQGDYHYRLGTSRTEVPNFLLRIEGGKVDPNAEEDPDVDEEDIIEGDD